MNKKQKKNLIRILVAAALMIALHFVPATGLLRFVLYLVPYLIVGYDVLKKAFKGIKNRQVFDENFLMAVATIGAMALAVASDGDYVEAIAVMLFYQVGELFQSYAVGKSRRNISELMDIRPDYANIEVDGQLEQVDPDEVEIGTVIVVQPGEKVPIDGVVVEGSSTLNTSALTGESLPRDVACGEEIISGCINMTGLLKIETTKEFGESTVSKILDLVENASSRKARSEEFISKFARIYTPAVCYSALALALLPPIVRMLFLNLPANWGDWVYRALTFLVISCPCALVISIPLSFFAGIGGASKEGILVKGSNFLETLSQTKMVVFDKTGTLTQGVFEVTEIVPAEEFAAQNMTKQSAQASGGQVTSGQACGGQATSGKTTSGQATSSQTTSDQATDGLGLGRADGDGAASYTLLSYAAYAESASSHPISKSLRKAYEAGGQEIDRSRVSDIHEESGMGVTAQVDGHEVAAGNAKLMSKVGAVAEPVETVGTVIYVAVDHVYAGYIVISDVMKPTAAQAMADLKNSGISRTIMLTGDRHEVAESVAKQLGIDEVYAELLPGDKVDRVEKLLAGKADKDKLAFVGDGINDAPVLSRADLGIAMGAMGSDAAIEAADVVLMDDDPQKIAKAIRISRKCLQIVYENIYFAIGVKLLCLLLGALGLANMWLAVFADVGVMVIAVCNAIRALFVKNL